MLQQRYFFQFSFQLYHIRYMNLGTRTRKIKPLWFHMNVRLFKMYSTHKREVAKLLEKKCYSCYTIQTIIFIT